MNIRYPFALAALVVACGGSSKTQSRGGGDDDDSSGTSGAGGSKGPTAGASSKGGTSSNGGTAGSVAGAALGGGGSDGAAPGAGGDLAGSAGSGGGSGALPGGGGTSFGTGGGLVVGQICNDDGCFLGDPNVMPIAPSGPIHCGGKTCAAGEACCMTSGACFDPEASPGACPRPPADDDQQGRRPCSSSAHCDRLFFCETDFSQLCGAVGHCQPISNCASCGAGGGGADNDDARFCRVCGCDGNTYPNVQTACLAGTPVAYQGAGCGETVQEGGGGAAGAAGSAGSSGATSSPPRIVTPCGTNEDCKLDGELCCSITNRCYPKDDGGQCAEPPEGTRFPCTSNAQCQDYEYCAGEGCGTPGGCKPRESGQCGVIFAPACGCDGVSYTSGDCAIQSGARVKSDGQCPEK